MKNSKIKSCEECDDEMAQMEGNEFKTAIWQEQLKNREKNREILINTSINDSIIEKAVIQIFNINQYDDSQENYFKSHNPNNEYNREPITIFINTQGGDKDCAFSLISAIESSKTPVITIALGRAWSAGFLILIAGHERLAQKHSSLMFHQGSAGIPIGEFAKTLAYADYFRKTQDMVDAYVLEKTKIKQKKLQEVFNQQQDWYLSSEEAQELGVIDGII